METTEIALSPASLHGVESYINQAVTEGKRVLVNGVLARYRHGVPARAWRNGSLSVKTPARYTTGTAEVWFKDGQMLKIVLEDQP